MVNKVRKYLRQTTTFFYSSILTKMLRWCLHAKELRLTRPLWKGNLLKEKYSNPTTKISPIYYVKINGIWPLLNFYHNLFIFPIDDIWWVLEICFFRYLLQPSRALHLNLKNRYTNSENFMSIKLWKELYKLI